MNYKVLCENQKVPVKTAEVFPSPYLATINMEYVQFTWKGLTKLLIHSVIPVDHVQIRPADEAHCELISLHDIQVDLPKPEKISLEINGSTESNLLIIPELHLSDPAPVPTSEEHVIYFRKGVHVADIISIKQDHTLVYLEPGAYVHGKITIENCQYIRICGHGVLSMQKYPYESRAQYAHCIEAMDSGDITIQDITLMDSNDWSLKVTGCEHVLIDNVKIFGCRGNSDGVDICGSRHVLVQNVFTRVWDDSLVVKALDTGDVEDVAFRHCTLWNDFARPMEVGVELRADHIHNVRYEDITVLHMPTGYPIMGVHHGDHALVSDVRFENIRIEDAPGAQLFDLRITPSYWNKDHQMGQIQNIYFHNIHVGDRTGICQLMSDSRIEGYDAEHSISGVHLEDITICGKQVQTLADLGIEHLHFADHVHLRPLYSRQQALHRLRSNISISKPFIDLDKGWYKGELSIELNNSSTHSVSKEIWLRLSPENRGGEDPKPVRIVIPPSEKSIVTYSKILQPGKYLASVQSKDPEIGFSWKFFELPLKLVQNWSDKFVITNYWGKPKSWIRARICSGQLYLQSPVLKNRENALIVYATPTCSRDPGEAVFSVEETDYGRSPALICGMNKLLEAPQLRCPLEITMVFQAQPKAQIKTVTLRGNGSEYGQIPLSQLGIPETSREFYMDIQICTAQSRKYRYPVMLFHSPSPQTSAHMYGHVIFSDEGKKETNVYNSVSR